MRYPVLVFKEKDKNLYGFVKDFGIASVGGENFYKNLTIVDSEGKILKLLNATVKGNAGFFDCIRYFQKMIALELTFAEEGYITLEDLKFKIIKHVEKHPKNWLALGTTEEIQQIVMETKNFEELIKMFK